MFKPIFEDSKTKHFFLLIAFLLVGFIEGIYGLLQQFELIVNPIGYFRVVGSFDNPGLYGNYLVTVFIFALGFYLYFKPISRFQNLLSYFALVTAITIIIILPFTKAN